MPVELQLKCLRERSKIGIRVETREEICTEWEWPKDFKETIMMGPTVKKANARNSLNCRDLRTISLISIDVHPKLC